MSTDRIGQIMMGNASGFGGTAPPTNAGRRADNVLVVAVDTIRPDPDNARKHFDADELAALAEDLKRHGQLQNLVVWHDTNAGQYQLIAGERRWRAAKQAGMKTLLCLVVSRELKDDIHAEMAFAENMARSQLRPTEVARHWQSLLERWNCSTRELAARVGVSQSTVSRRLGLLKLDADTQKRVDAGEVRKTSAVESTRQRRRNTAGRLPRGVHEFKAGTVKLRRGFTLADLVAQIMAAAAPTAEPPAAAA